MKTATIELPSGEALEREIAEVAEVAVGTHDERILQTIAERVAIANAPEAAFGAHDEVFAATRARLTARLTGKAKADGQRQGLAC